MTKSLVTHGGRIGDTPKLLGFRWQERNCLECNKLFTTIRGEYCSKKCAFVKHRRSATKTCPACAKMFTVGKQENHSKNNITCSRQCGTLLHYRKLNNAKVLLAVDAAYLAGIVDGEGSIVELKRKDGSVKGHRLMVANTDLGLLNWCVDITGVGNLSLQHKQHVYYKDCYSWRVTGIKARSIMWQLLPYLKIKLDKAMKATNMYAEELSCQVA